MNAYDQSREALRLLKCLPAEVLNQIISNLPNIDIKNLRQTCIYFKDIARPRINRLFLSTNLQDIQVFRAVADHEIYRHEVIEIIYDDVRFSHTDNIDSKLDYNIADDIGDATGTPLWFRDVYHKNRRIIKSYDSRYIKVKEAFGNPLGPVESFKPFKILSQQQQGTIATNRDADALKYGLSRLTNLRRVTITPAAHGVPGRPLYYTPAIRSLAQGILYPIERGWPVTILGDNQLEEEDWNEEEKAQWRGYFLISRTLAQHLRDNPRSKFTELVIDTNQLRTGISSRIFKEAESSEKTDLITILSQPGFTRLDLSLHCGNQHEYDWCSFGSGRLRNLLAKATDIQHISLFTNMAMRTEDEVDENFFPLRSIFPVSDWHQLRHFGLSRFHVQKDDVIELLKSLPQTLMSVELSFLLFFPDQGNYQTLLEDMRDKLGWRERRLVDQPKIVVRIDAWFEPALGAVLQDLSREVDSFVYHDGENPFEALEELNWLTNVTEGAGVLVDAFGPDYE